MKSVALIPARSGSKRVPDKNIKELYGHPLIAYTIRASIESGVFSAVVCATDSQEYADIATYYGAEVPTLRPTDFSGDASPDIEWISWLLSLLKSEGRVFDVFSILRPTSPFRMPETIRRAWNAFSADSSVDSLRAIEKCTQHPGKMWVVRGGRMLPLMPFGNGDIPWHSSQYVALPEVYVQNASLEIAWCKTVFDKHSIAGESVIPFVTNGLEGFDINDPEDWLLAERHIGNDSGLLPKITIPPYRLKN